MIEELRPYAETAPSGVPWLGDVPAHWQVKPGFALFREQHTKNIGMIEKRVLSLSYGRIIVKPEEKLRGLVPESFETYQVVEPGDLIIRSTDLQNDQTSLRVGLVRDRGIITSAYLCMGVTDAALPSYGYRLLNAYDLMKVLYGYGSGLRQNLEWADFKRMPVVIPPHDEQALIVRFLDHATGKIDRAIHAKRRVIALLNEQKQAIIHRTVTRGLDPHVPLKDSGIPWLEKIPSNWRSIAIKHLLSRMDYGTSEAAVPSGVIPVLTMGNIQNGEITLPKAGGIMSAPAAMLLVKHDLLFTRTNGNPDLVGKVGLFRATLGTPVTFASYLVRLRVRKEHNPEWLHLVLNSSEFWSFARSHALVNLQTNLNATRYASFRVPVPPRELQDAIVDSIRNSLSPLEASMAMLSNEIRLFQEYRTRLIADVVTGKLDVRAVAATLPAQAVAPIDALTDADMIEDADELLEEEAA